jgi:hypothetical protein
MSTAGPAGDPLHYTSGSMLDAATRLHLHFGQLPAGSSKVPSSSSAKGKENASVLDIGTPAQPNLNFNFRDVPNDQRTTEFYKFRYDTVCMGFNMQTDPTKISEEDLRKNVLYNAALADMVRDGLCLVDRETVWRKHVEQELKKAKEEVDGKTQEVDGKTQEVDGKTQEVTKLNAELLDLHRQLRLPNPGPVFTTSNPRIFRVKDINLPTYDGDTSVAAINDFLTAMERGLREASTQSLGIEVLLDTRVWSNAAIMQLRNPTKASYPGALQWANNKWIPGVHTTPTWDTFKQDLKDCFIPSSAKQHAVRAFDDLAISKAARMDSFNQEFLRLASNVKLATGEDPADLLGAYIKKLDRAASKQQLAIDYEKWVFDIEQRGDQPPDLATTMNWVDRLDERIYHRSSRDLPRSGPGPTTTSSSPPVDPDAMDWQANLTRLVNESMEANFTKMGFNKRSDKKKPGNSTSLSSTMPQAYEATQECWGCKKIGHIRKNCPQKASNGGPGFGPQVNATETTTKTTISKTSVGMGARKAEAGNGDGEQ